MSYKILSLSLILIVLTAWVGTASAGVDTGQQGCYDTSGNAIPCPEPGDALFGQDANYITTPANYQDNGNGTITDLNTGLMWQQDPGEKITWEAAIENAETLTLGGYDDWRVPTITELYSLMDFNGVTGVSVAMSVPYINTDYFIFQYGNEAAGERIIDAQFWSSTRYVSTTMGGAPTAFGVNFADGRIKGYPITSPRGESRMFVRYVRGSSTFDQSNYVDNGDGTISDTVSSLMWMQDDSGVGMDWGEALATCESSTFAGYDDWRVPDAKELQGLVDYTRAPDVTNSAAIDPIFNSTPITNELGQTDYAYYWTSTTHFDGPTNAGWAVYIAFGRGMGYMNGRFMDVHGAGSQRSDPKTGIAPDPTTSRAPQGDTQRIDNMVRCVRGGDVQIVTGGNPIPITVGLPPARR